MLRMITRYTPWIKCLFCQKEYAPVASNSFGSLLVKCNEHDPAVVFASQSYFTIDWKGFTVAVDIEHNLLKIIDIDKDVIHWSLISSSALPETRDIKQFTNFLDRLLNLQAFS